MLHNSYHEFIPFIVEADVDSDSTKVVDGIVAYTIIDGTTDGTSSTDLVD